MFQPSSALAASITMLDWNENSNVFPRVPWEESEDIASRSNGCFLPNILYWPLWALYCNSLIFRVCLPSAATLNLVPYFLDQVRLPWVFPWLGFLSGGLFSSSRVQISADRLSPPVPTLLGGVSLGVLLLRCTKGPKSPLLVG